MLEKDIVQAILKYLKTVPECFAWKEHGKLTKLQEATIRKIKAAKGMAFKVTSVDEVKQIIELTEVWHD